jgi:DNA-binding GntR family transcriptional regulator
LPFSRERVEEALVELAAEGFIEYRAGRLAVKGGA